MLEMRAAARRRDAEAERDTALAWSTAVLSRADRIPALAMLLRRKAAPPMQDPEVIAAMGMALARAWGAQVEE